MTALIEVDSAQVAIQAELLSRTAGAKIPVPRTLENQEWPPDYDTVLVWRQTQLAKFELDPKSLENAIAFYSQFNWRSCAAFINHWCDTYDPRNAGIPGKKTWMPFILFKKQEELVQMIFECLTTEQPGLVEKSREMGASWLCVCISIWMWLFIPGSAIGWGSRDKATLSVVGDLSSVFEKIRQLIKRLPKEFMPSAINETDDTNDKKNLKAMQIINPDNGATIVGQIGDNIGRGARTRAYFKDESSFYEHPELVDASLSATTRVPIDISSVNGLGNLFHRKREAGLDWTPGRELPLGKTRVFVLDIQDAPLYKKEWLAQKKQYWQDLGSPHIYASEYERNYAASVTGVIIPKDWLDACLDAHVLLQIDRGPKMAGLDIGDSEDGDRNAMSLREGIVLTYAEEWVARDPGVTARKAISICVEQKCPELQYDAGGGLGSNVKSQVNMLLDDNIMPKNFRVVPWNPGGKVLEPAERVNKDDKDSPKNKDYYTNLKAQAWHALRQRVYLTYQLVTALKDGGKLLSKLGDDEVVVITNKGEELRYDNDDLFSIDSGLPLVHKVAKELCQATAIKGAKLKLLVDKAPEGTKSPNIADSIVMAYWPMPSNVGDFLDVGAGPKIFIGGAELS